MVSTDLGSCIKAMMKCMYIFITEAMREFCDRITQIHMCVHVWITRSSRLFLGYERHIEAARWFRNKLTMNWVLV